MRDGNVGIFVESETLLDLTECVALTDGCAAAIASKNLVAIRLSHCSRLTDTALEVRYCVLRMVCVCVRACVRMCRVQCVSVRGRV